MNICIFCVIFIKNKNGVKMTKPIKSLQSAHYQRSRSLRSNNVIPKVSAAKKMQNDDSDYEADKEQGQSFKYSQLNDSSQSDDSSDAKKNSQSAKLSHDNDTKPKKRKHLECSVVDTKDSVRDKQDSAAENVSSAFKNSLNVLSQISKLVASLEEETTEQESSDAHHQRFVRFLKPINYDKVDYKIYIKGLSSQSGTRYGVSIKKLDDASKKRKTWSNIMKNSDRDISPKRKDDEYYIYPNEVTGHYSHALPNCFEGTETPANAAYATRANFSSRYTGQGDAQGIIEQALREIYAQKVAVDKKLKSHKQKSPDLRWKSSDAFSQDGQLMYRRIKIYASDTYGAISKGDDKYNYAEIMLGEFFLPGHLAVSKKSALIKELETTVSKMQKNFNDLINVYKDNISQERDVKFWRSNSFIARSIEFDGVKKSRSHIIESSEKFPSEYYEKLTGLNPVQLQEKMSNIAEVQKQNRDDTFLKPLMIKTSKPETLDDVINKICDNFKNTDINTLNDLRRKHQKLFNALEASNNSKGKSPDMDDNTVPIDVDEKKLENCHRFFSDLIKNKIVTNNEVKLLANRMMLPQKGNSLYVNHTPITSWIFAILRIAKKVK